MLGMELAKAAAIRNSLESPAPLARIPGAKPLLIRRQSRLGETNVLRWSLQSCPSRHAPQALQTSEVRACGHIFHVQDPQLKLSLPKRLVTSRLQ